MKSAIRAESNSPQLVWDPEAEDMLRRVPFFVRPLARRKVEEYARDCGVIRVTPSVVAAARDQFLKDPAGQTQTYWELDACRGEETGCPFAITSLSNLRAQVEEVLKSSGWKEFLERTVTGPLLHHHRLRVAVCACPNACTQPQIKDIGLIAALRPTAVSDACAGCGLCVEVCREGAIELRQKRAALQPERCVACGLCLRHCPADALSTEGVRFRLLIGGKLGRHPRLATELASDLRPPSVVGAVRIVIEFIKSQARPDERIGELVERVGHKGLAYLQNQIYSGT